MSRHITDADVIGVLNNQTTIVYRRRPPQNIARNISGEVLKQMLSSIKPLSKGEQLVESCEFQAPLGLKTITSYGPDDKVTWLRRKGYGDNLFPFVLGKKSELTNILTLELLCCKKSGRHILLRAYLGEALELQKSKHWPKCFAFTKEEQSTGKTRRPNKRDIFRTRR